MRNPLIAGSVVASTDDGHDAPAIGPTSADWAFGHPEKIIDHGHRAVHLTAVTAKAITAAFYGRAPAHSYFVGCSKGGQEGFMEAQRYPEDFDGIVSGAVANQWTDFFSSFMWTENLNLANQESYLSPDDLAKIGTAVSAACDTVAASSPGSSGSAAMRSGARVDRAHARQAANVSVHPSRTARIAPGNRPTRVRPTAARTLVGATPSAPPILKRRRRKRR